MASEHPQPHAWSSGVALQGRRGAELTAMFMIGDGVLGLLQPERHIALWRSRSPSVDALVRPFAGRSETRRLYGAAQVAAGLLLAASLRREPATAR